jgi:hypothetical protein
MDKIKTERHAQSTSEVSFLLSPSHVVIGWLIGCKCFDHFATRGILVGKKKTQALTFRNSAAYGNIHFALGHKGSFSYAHNANS